MDLNDMKPKTRLSILTVIDQIPYLLIVIPLNMPR